MTSIPMCLAVTQASRVSFIRFMIKFGGNICIFIVTLSACYPGLSIWGGSPCHRSGRCCSAWPRPPAQSSGDSARSWDSSAKWVGKVYSFICLYLLLSHLNWSAGIKVSATILSFHITTIVARYSKCFKNILMNKLQHSLHSYLLQCISRESIKTLLSTLCDNKMMLHIQVTPDLWVIWH